MEMKAGSLLPETGKNITSAAARIEIVKTFFLRGPSIWTYRPILEAWVDIGELEDRPSNLIPGLYERLSAWLPGLIAHRCTPGVRGGFLQRLREGTWAAHILEHVAIELQIEAGIAAGFGQARETSKRGLYKVVFRTPNEAIGRAALHGARDLLLAAINNHPFDVDAAIRCLSHVVREHQPDANTACVLEAAARRRIPAIPLNSEGLFQLGYGKQQRRIWMNKISLNSAIAEGMADDCKLARKMLTAAGIPLPHATALHDVHDLAELWSENNPALVLRPRDARSGGAILPAANTWQDLKEAHQIAGQGNEDVLAEEFITGSDYRLLVTGKRVVAAIEFPSLRDVTEELHDDVATLASTATRVLGLDVAEVRLIASTLSQSLHASGGRVVAVKARVDLQPYCEADPALGEKAASALIDHLFGPEGEGEIPGAIPIVSVSGSRGTTETAHTVAHLLGAHYSQTGLVCADGLYVGMRRIEQGDHTNWHAAQRLLRIPAVGAAVCEHRWESILSEGLGYERSKVSIVMRVDENDVAPAYDLLDAQQMQKVTRTPVDVVLPDGAAVLNADDAATAELARFCDGEVIYFSRQPASALINQHRAAGGRAVLAGPEGLIFAAGCHESAIRMELGELPAEQIECMLAAAGAAWALDISPRVLCRSLAAVHETTVAAELLAVE